MQRCVAVYPPGLPNGVEVRGTDLARLEDGAFLNDTVIDLYIRCCSGCRGPSWQRVLQRRVDSRHLLTCLRLIPFTSSKATSMCARVMLIQVYPRAPARGHPQPVPLLQQLLLQEAYGEAPRPEVRG